MRNTMLINYLKYTKMRKVIIIFTSSVFLMGAILTGCQFSTKKVEDARNNLVDAKENVILAKQELSQALKDSIQQFRLDSEKAIRDNEKSIFELNSKIAANNKENNDKYKKQIAELGQKNMDLKKKLWEYKYTELSKWESFKVEFNHDMKELGKALKDLTVDNSK